MNKLRQTAMTLFGTLFTAIVWLLIRNLLDTVTAYISNGSSISGLNSYESQISQNIQNLLLHRKIQYNIDFRGSVESSSDEPCRVQFGSN